jgi:hypothetical protein
VVKTHSQWFEEISCCIIAPTQFFFAVAMKGNAKYVERGHPTLEAKLFFDVEILSSATLPMMSS